MSVRPFPHRLGPGPGSLGFTLLEVILALAVFAMIAGGLFGTIRAVLQSTATLREAQRETNGIYGVFSLCRRTFATLPAAATILSANYTGGTPLPYELDLDNAPTAFAFGEKDFFYGETAVTARKEDDGTFTFGIEYRRLDPDTGLPITNPEPLWLPLLKDLDSVQWHYYDGTADTWYDTWSETTRPSLVQLVIVRKGDPREWSQTFLVPTLATQLSFSASAGGGGGGRAARSGSGGSSSGQRGGNGNGNRNGGGGNGGGNRGGAR